MDLPLDVATSGGLAALAGVLVVLALVDSTSIGTLVVPVWLMLAPGRLRAGRLLVYLATVAASYLVVGVLVLLGAGAFLDLFGDVLDSRPVLLGQLLLGIGLLIWSFRFDGRRTRGADGGTGSGGDGSDRPGRLSRWRGRVTGTEGSVGPLVGLAVTAVAVEVASMLPYLAAIGLLTASDLSTPVSVGALAVYCLVMVLPALLLLGGRVLAARRIEPWLRRLDGWLVRYAAETLGWVLGIVGVLLALDAVGRLGWS